MALPPEEANRRRSEKLKGTKRSLETRAAMSASHLFPHGTPEWQEHYNKYIHKHTQKAALLAGILSGELLGELN